MQYAFFGTPRFAEIIIEELIKADKAPSLIVCNPDRPTGRKKIITSPPTKVLAQNHNIKFFQPEKLSLIEVKKQTLGIDLFIVAAYSKIIKKDILDLPKLGTFGIHPSLLPKYRGASPIQSVILAGETETGTTIYRMDEAIDHGPIALQNKIGIDQNDTYLTLEEKLAKASAKLLKEFFKRAKSENISIQEQNHTEATTTKKFETIDAFVNLEKDSSEAALRKIRALNPEPGAWTVITSKNAKQFLVGTNEKTIGRRVKILRAEIKNGVFAPTEIQIEGEKPKNI